MAVAPKNSIDLYFWPTPNGHKVTIFLEEAGLPYTVISINISKGEQFQPEFLAISLNNRIPVIVDPEGLVAGRSPYSNRAQFCNSGLKTGKFYATDERRRVDVDQWLLADGRARPDGRTG